MVNTATGDFSLDEDTCSLVRLAREWTALGLRCLSRSRIDSTQTCCTFCSYAPAKSALFLACELCSPQFGGAVAPVTSTVRVPATQSLAKSALNPALFTRTEGSPLLSVFCASSFGKLRNATMLKTRCGSPLPGPKASSLSKCTPMLVVLPPLLLSMAVIAFQSHVIFGSGRVYI